jgi:hypothetical protein
MGCPRVHKEGWSHRLGMGMGGSGTVVWADWGLEKQPRVGCVMNCIGTNSNQQLCFTQAGHTPQS